MRITNTSGSPRHFSYIGSGGKTLTPGEMSCDLPLSLLYGTEMSAKLLNFNAEVGPITGTQALHRDLAAGKCTVSVTAEDIAWLARVAALIA